MAFVDTARFIRLNPDIALSCDFSRLIAPLRLPENRGVPGSIPGLATLTFCLLIAGFCACQPAVLHSPWGRLSAFRVQLSVLNGPHSGVEAPTSGDQTATLVRSSARAKVATAQAARPGVRQRPGGARTPAAAKRPRPGGTGDARRLTRRPCSRPE